MACGWSMGGHAEAGLGPVRAPGERRWQLEPAGRSGDEGSLQRLVGGKWVALLIAVI